MLILLIMIELYFNVKWKRTNSSLTAISCTFEYPLSSCVRRRPHQDAPFPLKPLGCSTAGTLKLLIADKLLEPPDFPNSDTVASTRL